MSLKPTRVEDIDDRKLYVFDDLFSESQIVKFHHSLLIANYSCLQATKSETRKFKEWVAGFDTEDFKAHWLYEKCLDILTTLPEAQGREYQCLTTFGNLFSFGSFTFSHSDSGDSENPEHDISFLYYANSEWDHEWGGETIFFSKKDMDAKYCVSVKPGRLIAFVGDVEHRSGIPNRYCEEHRFTFSIRFIPTYKDKEAKPL